VDPPRQAFLEFCLDHDVEPAEALAAMRDFPSPALADLLLRDESIRMLCVGRRWLWAQA
jgi:hypothetical protein